MNRIKKLNGTYFMAWFIRIFS